MLLALAIGGPALAIGGVLPEVVLVFLLVVGALTWRLCTKAREPLRIPWIALVFFAFAGLCTLQWAPIPGLRSAFAPGLDAWVERATATVDLSARPGLSVSPNDTALESARLVGLAALMICAAGLSWRLSAAAITATALAVAFAGLAHELFGLSKIYGVFAAQDASLERLPSMLGTFVNPNHQSGLLLLGIFSAASLATDQWERAQATRDASQAESRRDRALAAVGVLLLLVPALLLSLSRGAIAALVLTLPAAGYLILRRTDSPAQTPRKRNHPLVVRLLATSTLVLVLTVFGQHGAWRELTTLWSDPVAEFSEKLGPAWNALELLEHATWLGTGRGTFVDLYPLVDPQPSHVTYSHLESAPFTAIIEWGPLFGTLFLAALATWWVRAFCYRPRRDDARARRLVLLGLLALAVQNIGDFSLEFLGVAAPTAALLGALSPPGARYWSPSKLKRWGLGALAFAFVIASVHRSGTWAHRQQVDDAVRSGEAELSAVIKSRPLDGALYAISARNAFKANDVRRALARSSIATQLRPASMDAWLQKAEAHARLQEPQAMRAALAKALERIHAPLEPDLVDYLVRRVPNPASLGTITPDETWAWRYLVRALMESAPAHADAVAQARAQRHPEDPAPLLLRSRIALTQAHPALAQHHARLAIQQAPASAAGYIASAQATLRLAGHAAAIEVLERARAEAPLSSMSLGLIEERLIRVLIALGTDQAIDRAREVAAAMARRPSSTKAEASRRRALLRELRALSRRFPRTYSP